MNGAATESGWWRAAPGDTAQEHVVVSGIGGASLRFPFWSLIAFTVILILAPQDHFTALKPLHLALVTGAFASGAYLLSRFSGSAPRPRHTLAATVALLLLLWAVVMVPFALWPGGSYAQIFNIYIKALIVFWLLGRVVNSEQRLRTVAWTLSLIAIPLSLSAISSFLKGGVGNAEMTHGLERIAGYQSALTGNPNDLALMLNLILPFALGLMMSSRKLSVRIVLAIIAFLDVMAVIATYSRGGFITLVAIVVTYLLCLSKRARRGMLLAMMAFGLLAVPLVPAGYWSRLSTITNIEKDQTGSAQQRWTEMVYATQIIASHPIIGAGAGMDYLALNKLNGGDWIRVHNVYLEYGVDLGLPGLLLFLLLYYRVLKIARTARRIARESPGNEVLHRLSEAIWIALIVFGVSAFFQPAAYDFYFFYIAGLAVAAYAIAASLSDKAHLSVPGKRARTT